MRLSIRARLTAWYGFVVVAVLITSIVAVAATHRRSGLQRLDGELERLMFTLDGVMRTEFNEGLTLEDAAKEASVEVIAPDRMLVLTRDSGELLQVWGTRLAPEWRPDTRERAVTTVTAAGHRLRVFSHPVEFGSHRYVAAVVASLDALEAEETALSRALATGAALALLVAIIGGWIVARQTLAPLTSLAGQATAITEQNLQERLVVPNRDDELGQFAASFNALLDRLAAALHAQRQFMADAAHELRTPVSVVRTTAQVTMAREARTDAEYRESLTIVGEQAARLSKLVDAMFLLARAEAQGLPLLREPLYLDDVVADSVRALKVIADERGIEIDALGATDVTISGDPLLMRQLITNLLDNATRHARTRVSVEMEAGEGEVAITVSDDGDGIDAVDRDRIFQRFVRLDPLSAGGGLGLPIARWIAEAHGGSLILVGSTGAVFRFSMPIA